MSSILPETRARARRLENDIDSKLVQLSRLDASARGSDNSSGGSSSFSQLQRETEELLQQLAEVNDEMSRDAASGGATGGTATAMHMLQRHREILHDFQQEFSKSKAALKAACDRSELLSSVRQDIRDHRCAASRASDTLLRERNAIHATERAADDIIDQAEATRDALAAQRAGFGGTGSKLRELISLAPQVDAVLSAIGRRQQREKVILGVVTGVCAGIVFVYGFG